MLCYEIKMGLPVEDVGKSISSFTIPQIRPKISNTSNKPMKLKLLPL